MTPFEEFLNELAQVLKFSSLHPDQKGACLVVLKEHNLPLLFEFDDDLVPHTVLISCALAPFPIEYRSAFYTASLIGNATIAETLSVKPDEEILYLHRRCQSTMRASEIELLLNAFINTAKTWQKKAQEITALPPPQTTSLTPPSILVFPYKV